MKRRTKIVCTLGPAVNTKERIRALIEAGMNVARLNCSHGDWDTKRQWIEWIRELSLDVAPVAVLADLQGPKFRIGELPGGEIELTMGQNVTIGQGDVEIPIEQLEIIKAMTVGARLLMGDGEIELKITGGQSPAFRAKTINGGTLKSRKGVTLVHKVFDSPALTDKDIEDVREAVKAGVDYLALSYVKDAADVRELRRIVNRLDPDLGICAKIETREAIKDLENILKVADIVMVARGDMGLQMELEEVPLMQKRIIDQCLWAGKPVITATQMLESMITNSRPTRAEATDVANAVLDGTDALMLSAETASGGFPIEAVKTMVRIAEKAEPYFSQANLERRFQEKTRKEGLGNTDAIAHVVAQLASLIKPAAIVTPSTSGQTPRLVSRFRSKTPILCATWNEKVMRQLAIVWGVEAVLVPPPTNTDETIHTAIDALLRKHKLDCGDNVIVTAGVPAGTPGNTNMILTQQVR
ncbi:MAG TPA: pyruvate kinase [Fimbriimonas sp.]|nr:pyruvate kinase [Fimbriimonas sp.]